tara:strand:- start:28 stop:2922 length:2895 start_codon:yes stop_codon:yes gene_type:complete
MSNILLINDNVQDYQTIINACNDNTYPITYNQGTDTYDSIFAKYENMISENNIQIVNHLALVSHGSNNPEFTFLEKENKMLISQYLPDLSNCASCQTNETQNNDLSLNNIDELFDNTPDIHKCIVDLSLNITPEEFDTKETYTYEEIISIFKDASCNVFDTLEPLRDITGSDEYYPMPNVDELIQNVYNLNIISSPENEDELTDSSINEFNEYILNTLDTWSTFKEFIKKFNIQTSLDFLGCVLLQSSDWKYTLETLETEQHLHLNIRASDDDTGNLKVGADWVLETDNVNIKELYFDGETIEKWYYTLNTNIPSVNIKFSDLKTLYNIVNSPASITNPFSLGKFKGCEFVQPIIVITFDSNYEEIFTSSGTFTVPAGVTEISAVCVGGGGGGSASTSSYNGYAGGGGGGGALHWRTLTVSPGTVFNINVGAAGSPGSSAGNNNAQNGGETSIKIGGTYYLRAGGGNKGNYNSNSQSNGGTTYYGTYGGGGGNGGNGGGGQSGNTSGGGGGAGGYSGNGGNGSTGTQYNETAGTGGGGGGGTGHNGWTSAGAYGGGGVGILIGQGTSGAANFSTYNKQGNPGSGGSNRDYGGGGAGSEDDSGAAGAWGGPGAVRIIWGESPGTRAYPSTLVPINSQISINPSPIHPVPLTNISIDTVFKGFTFKNMKPTMTITASGSGGSAVSDGDSTNDTYLNLTFTSSEPTSDFVQSDITVNNGTISQFNSTSPTVYTAKFTPTSLTDGTAHSIDVPQGAYTNNKTTIGCQNNAATQFNWTYVESSPEFGHFNTTGTATIYGSLSGASVSPSGYNFTSWTSTNVNWNRYSMGSEFEFNTAGKIIALGAQNRNGGNLSIFKTTTGTPSVAGTVVIAGTGNVGNNIEIKYYTLNPAINVLAGEKYRTSFKNTNGGYAYTNTSAYQNTNTTSGNIKLLGGVYHYDPGGTSNTTPIYPNSGPSTYTYAGTDIIFTI